MISAFSHPLSVTVSLLAVFGMLSHDTQIDNAVSAAASKTSSKITSIDPESIRMKLPEQHTHVNSDSFTSGTISLRAQQPASQAKTEDEKKYIAQRRLSVNAFGSEYSWPSI
ncbi:MAG: hypothetical protein WCH58_04385 [Candidatus Saccharibacteria bacterium]